MNNLDPEQQSPDHAVRAAALIVPLNPLDRTLIPLVGGKAAQLGELLRAGFAVPAGFCITTTAYVRVAASAELETLLSALSTISATDTARLGELATAVHSAILQAPVPSDVTAAITEAYQALGQGKPVPVGVRSSATAEDLPDASFAGQQ